MEKDYFINPRPPYISQFATKSLISDLLDKKIKPREDTNWKKMGFNNKDEYEYWSFRMCGLICTIMVIHAYKLGKNESISQMLNKALEYKGYDIKMDRGWLYEPLVIFANSYGLKGEVNKTLTIEKIISNTLNDIFTIVSVNPKVIRFDEENCKNRKDGGHLVLITGLKMDGKIKGFYIHNTSGRTEKTRKNAYIPIEIFENAFAERGFSLKKK